MARIERFTSRIEAEMACAMLTANGIDARVSADDAGGVHPEIPFGIGGTAVVVPDDQLEEARELLDEVAAVVTDRRSQGAAVVDEDTLPSPSSPSRVLIAAVVVAVIAFTVIAGAIRMLGG